MDAPVLAKTAQGPSTTLHKSKKNQRLVEWVTLLDEDYPAAVDTGTRGSHVPTRGLELGYLMVPFDRKSRADANPL